MSEPGLIRDRDAKRIAEQVEDISAAQKRIAELEADKRNLANHIQAISVTADSERQRREEAEALLKSMAPIVVDAYATNGTHTFCLAAEMIRQHFRKYEPIPAEREEERGG